MLPTLSRTELVPQRGDASPLRPDPRAVSAGGRFSMLQALVQSAQRLVFELTWGLRRGRSTPADPPPASAGERGPAPRYQPLERILLTDGVSRTLFEEYAEHRASARGDEETGWVLLGLREAKEAIALATLPAGTQREAGVAHVQFNALAQALGSRIVRQVDRRLSILGIVHTHPGSLRHPSDADFRGDSEWVGQLRGKEGIFAIGTADGNPATSTMLGRQPKPHVQCLGKLCLSWYGLRDGAGNYRALPVELTLGPDLARPLHAVWSEIEAHAERLDRLARQQAGVIFEVIDGRKREALAVTVPLAEPGDAIRVLLEDGEVSYFLARGGDLVAADSHETRVDQGVYLLLAELAAQS
ncbi:MAG: Mov34/MPN/PAD-1 family protein [Gemmataceae bacterium]|nr:Mov34/MPN/PAD-1 family protein [Gemmataceae bacterium]